MTRSVLIYANCQGEELMLTGHYLRSFADDIVFKWIPAHKVTATEWETQYGTDYMRDVVAVWEQVESGQPTANRAALHQRLPTDCEIVKFPPLSALFLWPFSGNDPRVAADPDRYPWPDSIGAVLSTATLDDEAVFARYMELTTERMPDLKRRLRLDAGRWAATDALADIRMGEWVEQNFRSVQLFHTSGHIAAAATGPLFKQLLRATRSLDRHRVGTALAETDTLLRHHQGQDFECVPIHPLVAEGLDLTWYDPNALYRWHGHDWTFRQYILHYIRWAPYLD
ncbi:MAG: WcbI family polysaccharide biosynthesis putative acetyltransferase [Rhodospirillales bacterium]